MEPHLLYFEPRPKRLHRQPAAQRAAGRADALLPARVEAAAPALARDDHPPRAPAGPPARRAPLLHPGGRAHLARRPRLRAGRRSRSTSRRGASASATRSAGRGRRLRRHARRPTGRPAPRRLAPPSPRASTWGSSGRRSPPRSRISPSEVCARLGAPRRFAPGDVPLVEGTYVGEAYGRPSEAGNAALERLARGRGDPARPGLHGQGLRRSARGARALRTGRAGRLSPHGRAARLSSPEAPRT